MSFAKSKAIAYSWTTEGKICFRERVNFAYRLEQPRVDEYVVYDVRKKTVHEYFKWRDEKGHRLRSFTKTYSNSTSLNNLRAWVKLRKLCRFSDDAVKEAVSNNPFMKVYTCLNMFEYVWNVFDHHVCVY